MVQSSNQVTSNVSSQLLHIRSWSFSFSKPMCNNMLSFGRNIHVWGKKKVPAGQTEEGSCHRVATSCKKSNQTLHSSCSTTFSGRLIYVFLSSSHTESFHAMQWRAQPSRVQLVIKLLWQCYMTCDHMTGCKLRKSESDELCHRGDSDDWWRWRWQGSHVPTWQLASTASGLTLATHCTGLQMKCKFCKISQKKLHNFVQLCLCTALHF